MGEFGQENERLRRIYDQPTWVLTHMDTDSFRSILEPAYKISRYRLLIAGKGCSSVLYPHSDPGPLLSTKLYCWGYAEKPGGVASQRLRRREWSRYFSS